MWHLNAWLESVYERIYGWDMTGRWYTKSSCCNKVLLHYNQFIHETANPYTFHKITANHFINFILDYIFSAAFPLAVAVICSCQLKIVQCRLPRSSRHMQDKKNHSSRCFYITIIYFTSTTFLHTFPNSSQWPRSFDFYLGVHLTLHVLHALH